MSLADRIFSSMTEALSHQHGYGNNRLAGVLSSRIQWPVPALDPADECKHLKVIPPDTHIKKNYRIHKYLSHIVLHRDHYLEERDKSF